MKDNCYVKLHCLDFFKKEKGMYNVYQRRGKGLENRRLIGRCMRTPSCVWIFVSFVYPYKSAVGNSRVEALRACMGSYVESYKSSAPADDPEESA